MQDVAVKLFKHQEYYDGAIVRFKQEVTFSSSTSGGSIWEIHGYPIFYFLFIEFP